MDRTNLKEGHLDSMWKGKFLKDMDDQTYVYTLEEIIKFLYQQIDRYRDDVRRLVEGSKK